MLVVWQKESDTKGNTELYLGVQTEQESSEITEQI